MSALLRLIRALQLKICDRTEEDESADSPATTLALLLLSGAPPLHASLGPAPQCRPLASQDTETVDVKPSLTADGEVILRFDAEDRDFMIRTIVFEAASEPEEGKIAVAYVILNRIKSGGWGDSIKDVVTSPWQFEPWMTKRDAMEKLSTTSPFRFLNSSWSTTKWFYQVPRKRL